MTTNYSTDLSDLQGLRTDGFFDDWPDPPDDRTFRRIIEGSDHAVLAIERGRLVGFVTAVTDGVLTAYVPLLEVLPSHRKKGVGSELVRRMLDQLAGLYAIDLACDEAVAPFYERLGFIKMTAMCKRDYSAQSGRSNG